MADPRKKTQAQILEEKIAEQAAGTFVDPVAKAQADLSAFQRPGDDAIRQTADDILAERQTRANAPKPSMGLRDLWDIASLNPERLGLQGDDLRNANIANLVLPSAVNVAGGKALGMAGKAAMRGAKMLGVPSAVKGVVSAADAFFGGPAFRATKAAGAAKTAAKGTYGAGDMGAAFSHEVPYRAGGGASTPSGIGSTPSPPRAGHVVGHDAGFTGTPPSYRGAAKPGMTAQPETLMQKVRTQLGMGPKDLDPADVPQSIRDIMQPGAGEAMDRGFAQNNPVFRGMEQAGAFGGNRAVTSVAPQAAASGKTLAKQLADKTVDDGIKLRGTPADVAHSPQAQVLEKGRQADLQEWLRSRGLGDDPLEAAHSAFDSGATSSHLSALDREHEAFVASRKALPPGDFIHPEDASGEMFGFENLPEISEAELSRMQQLFDRLGL